MFGHALLFVYVFLAFWSPCLGKRELVFVLIVHLFVSYAHVTPCHFFSSFWCRGLAAVSACGSSWTFLFTFFFQFKEQTYPTHLLHFKMEDKFKSLGFSCYFYLFIYFFLIIFFFFFFVFVFTSKGDDYWRDKICIMFCLYVVHDVNVNTSSSGLFIFVDMIIM